MTDDDADAHDEHDDDGPSATRGALDRFKAGAPATDEETVNDASGSQSRLMWNPLADTEGTPPDAPAAGGDADDTNSSGFHFDLGGALARLSGDAPPQAPAAPAPPTPAAEPPAPSPPSPPTQQPTPTLDPAPVARHDQQPTPTLDPAPVARHDQQPTPTVDPAPVARHDQQPTPTLDPAPVSRHDQQPTPTLDPAPVARHDQQPPASSPTAPAAPDVRARTEPPARVEPPPTRPAPTPPADLFADEPPADYPRRIPGSHLSELHVDPRKARDPHPAPPVDEPPAAPAAAAPTSVFEDVKATAAPTLPSMAPELGAPTLPASNPAAPPPMVEPVTNAASTNDINALRSAQMRQSRQQRKGKLFGRIVLAFVIVGGLLAAALLFGRSLLFQNDWDAALTPLVNEIQESRGAEFEQTVPLVTLDAEQFGARLRTGTIGDAWVDRVPEWRALGLATGTVTEASVTEALVESRKAIYDPASDTIYQLEGSVADDDLRVALESAFDEQLDGEREGVPAPAATLGFTGVSSPDSIATRAVESFASGAASERRPANEALPLPISYELAAIEVLGEPILSAAGVDPSTFTLGSALPEDLGTVLDDGAATTPSALLQPGERSLAEPVALGVDDWSLVWGARLPQASVDRLVDAVIADSYRPIERDSTACFVAVFQTGSESAGATVFAEMLAWTAAAPAESQAVASQLGPQRVQLSACDPGADFGTAPNPGTVDALIDRQSVRLTN